MRFWRFLIPIGLVVLVGSAPVSGAVIYVKHQPGPLYNGLSWSTAFDKVQDAVNAAVSGDEIWVAGGTYTENVVLKSAVALYGGFAGTESSRTQRDWVTNVTKLDGNKAASVVEVAKNAISSTRLDGFTITNGRATLGGGVYCNEYSVPVIANNTITGNTAAFDGGGIYSNLGSAPVIADNKICGNGAVVAGGGVRSISGGTVLISNLITCNSARRGGGVSFGEAVASHEYLINNTIVANSAEYGGGVYCAPLTSVSISNNLVACNSSGVYKESGTGAPTLKNNCLYANDDYAYSGLSAGTGDISADPQLGNTHYGQYHIQPDSTCREAGNNAEVVPGYADIDGQARIAGTVDIGADESDGTSWNSSPVIVRVSPSGSDSNDGSTWALAKRTIQAAIDAVAPPLAGDGGGEVWVKAGTYNERIAMRDFVYIYGGFAGTESSASQRNWRTNLTTIDGGAAGCVVTAALMGYRVSAIDGFQIRNGMDLNGAGVFCDHASPLVMNNTITANSASIGGGGVCLSNSSAVVKNNEITGNTSLLWGGAVFSQHSGARISANNIHDNSACYSGPAVHATMDSTCTLVNNMIVGNHENSAFPGAFGTGVSVFSYSSVDMICNTIADNSPGTRGAVYCGPYGTLQMRSNIVAFNSTGIFADTALASSTVAKNCVYGNSGYQYTGLSAGIGDISSDPEFTNGAGGNYSLLSGSACIDAADPATAPSEDFAGTTRPIDGDGNGSVVADIGCYEYGVFVPEYPVAPTSASANPSSMCSGITATLHATGGSGITLRWLKGGCDGTSVGTGNDLVLSTTSTTTYYARWESSLGNSTCASTTVTISGISPTATVGGPQEIRPQGTTSGLGGSTPAPPATGAWSIVSGGTGTFNPNNTTPNATFTHTSGAGPVVLRWTVSSSPCPAATADVTVIIAYACLLNGSFDGGTGGGIADGWSKQTPESGTWSLDTTTKHSGVASQKIADSLGTPSFTTWLYQTVSVKPGRVYVPTMWIYRVGNAVARIGLDPNGGTAFSAGDAAPTSNTWVYRVNDPFTVGSAEAVTIGLAAGYNGGSGTIYFDDVAIKPQAPQLSGGAATINSGSSATLTASGGFGGDAFEMCWYTGPVGTGTKTGTGTSLAVSPTSTTTYYPRWETSGGCGISDDGTPVTITVIPAPVPPTVTSIVPSAGPNTGSISITGITGTGFLAGATAKLKRTGQSDITATSVAVVSPTKITCSLALTGKKTGLWDVYVQNTDLLSGTLTDGFGITVSDSLPSVGMSIKRLLDSIMSATSLNRRVRVWGRVETINPSTFWLDDGSGTRVKVFAPGYVGLVNGDFASATGGVDVTSNPPVLVSSSGEVRKY